MPELRKVLFLSFYNRPDRRIAMVHEALRYIGERPDVFAFRTVNRIRAFWGFDYIAAGRIKEHWRTAGMLPVLAVEAGDTPSPCCWSFCGFFLVSRAMATRYALFLLAVVLAYQLPYMIVYGCGCYHHAVISFLFPFAGVTLDEAQRGGMAFWRTIRGMKWLWVAVVVFLLIQIEYAWQVMLYRGT